MNLQCSFVLVISVAVACCRSAEAQPVSDTAFTYQGELEQNGIPVSQQCDFEFSLWTGNNAPDPGAQVGPDVEASVQVDEGIFTAELDFGADPLDGSARWLNIAVCCATPCAPGYTELAPRQLISSSPFSVQTRGIFVDENERVGIGTTSPNALLSVGEGNESELQIGASPQLSLSKDLANNKFRMQLTGSGHFGRILQIGRDDTNHDIVLSGDVGIGTDSPNSLLSVGVGDDAVMQLGMSPQLYFSKDVGSTKFRMQLTGTGYGGYDLQIGRDDTGHDIILSGDVSVDGQMSFVDGYGIDGKLGIGIQPNVETMFHVNTDEHNYGVLVESMGFAGGRIGLHANSSGFSSLAKNAYYSDTWRRFNTGLGAFLQEIDPDGDTSFSTAPSGGLLINWNRAMVLKSDGKIGMGTNNPSVKLHVIGSQTIEGNQTVIGNSTAQGAMTVGGNLDIGLELLRETCFDCPDLRVTCPAGKVLVGGGCSGTVNAVTTSAPLLGVGEVWQCTYSGLQEVTHIAYAFCARVIRTENF